MRNRILKGITTMVTIVAVISAGMVDSESDLPYVVCAICLIWLAAFMYANREVLKKYER